ncbi:thiamine-binding protein [Mesonia sp. MT50]|uniref:Thiamine-binding protein n=1 Tax=Mesonia profundi TaxID=3070998 RepID=A0ABU0ZZV9_9FLAO|nr:thiamine-binding protein [Mesonia profundi]MDQ7916273.1 thiamine-binding protein [Mesonia profundi]
MKISVELTLTPIQDEYEPAIINFIDALRDSDLEVKENPLSTQVYGDYDEVMKVLNKEMKNALEAVERGLIYMKIVKSDRRDYEPHF